MRVEIEVDGRLIEAEPSDMVEVEPGVFSILRGGHSYEALVIGSNGQYLVQIKGVQLSAEVRDPRNARRASNSSVGHGRQSITAPMPGKVVRVLVAQGDVVETGSSLVVVEAMKMQNEMKAAKSGTVSKVLASEGATVVAGEVLVVIE